MFSVLFPVSLSRLRTPRGSRHEFSPGGAQNQDEIAIRKKVHKRYKRKKDKKCKNGRVSSLLYHISKLTIPFLCPHKILSSSYAMFVLLYPLYYLYLTNCNTLVRNNKKSLSLLLHLIVSLMLKHGYVKSIKPQLHYWRREKDRLRSQTNHHLYGTNPRGQVNPIKLP